MTMLRSGVLLLLAAIVAPMCVLLLLFGEEEEGLVLGLGIGLGVAVLVVPFLIPTIRGLELRRLADLRRWTWEKTDPDLAIQHSAGEVGLPITHFEECQARRVVRGTHDGWEFVAFDLVADYESHGAHGPMPSVFAVVVLPVTYPLVPDVPPLTVVPKRRGEQWERNLHRHGLRLEGRFLRRFRASADHQEAAEAALTPEVQGLLRKRPHEAWQVRPDCWILLSRTGMWPRTLTGKLEQAHALREALLAATTRS